MPVCSLPSPHIFRPVLGSPCPPELLGQEVCKRWAGQPSLHLRHGGQGLLNRPEVLCPTGLQAVSAPQALAALCPHDPGIPRKGLAVSSCRSGCPPRPPCPAVASSSYQTTLFFQPQKGPSLHARIPTPRCPNTSTLAPPESHTPGLPFPDPVTQRPTPLPVPRAPRPPVACSQQQVSARACTT